HGVDHQLRRVVVPQHDVDALAGQFVGHGLHARTAHADAGTDRVDALVVGFHGDLGARARITGGALDLDQLSADVRYFDLEQFDQHLRRRAAGEQLRATVFRVDAGQVGTDAVVLAHGFARDHLVAGDQRLGVAAQVQDDAVACRFLDGAADQITDAITVFLDDLGALGFAHFLH